MNKVFHTFIFSILFSCSCGAIGDLDSLEQLYKTQKERSEKTETALRIAEMCRNVDNAKAELFVNKAINLSISDANRTNLAHAYELKGSILTGMGQNEKALDLLFGAINIYEELDSIAQLSNAYNSVANSYLDLEDTEKCKKYYTLSYEFALKTKDTARIAVPLVGLGIAHSKIGEYKPALEYSLKAAELFKVINRFDGYSVCIANAASYAYDSGDRRLADSLMNESNKAALILNDKYFKGEILIIQSEWLGKDGNYEEAILLAERGISLMKEIDAKSNVMDGLAYLSNYYGQTANYHDAYKTLKEYTDLKDSLNEKNKTKTIEELNTKYETAQKEQVIAKLNNEKYLGDIENKNNRNILMITGIASIFILALAIFSLRAFFQKRKSNTDLQAQKSLTEKKNKEILGSINYAKRIQKAILPTNEALKESLEKGFVLFLPKDIVSGDFYWLEVVGNDTYIAVADCTGHGVPGAMVSVVCHNALNRAVREYKLSVPSQILDKTRELVVETFKSKSEFVRDGMDISLCKISKGSKKIQWAGANNALYIYKKEENGLEIISSDKQPVGYSEYSRPFKNHEIELSSNDRIYLFSDGFVDQFGGLDGKKYKHLKFRDLLIQKSNGSIENQKQMLEEEFIKWKGNLDQIDDICIIGIEF